MPFYTLIIHTQMTEVLRHTCQLFNVQSTIDWHSRCLQSRACDGYCHAGPHLISHVPVSRLQEVEARPPRARCPGAQLSWHCTRSRVTSPHSRPVTARVTRSLRRKRSGREGNVALPWQPWVVAAGHSAAPHEVSDLTSGLIRGQGQLQPFPVTKPDLVSETRLALSPEVGVASKVGFHLTIVTDRGRHLDPQAERSVEAHMSEWPPSVWGQDFSHFLATRVGEAASTNHSQAVS